MGLDDDKVEANRKESMMGWYKPDRFVFDKKYVCQENKILQDSNLIKQFVSNCQEGKEKVKLESIKIEDQLRYARKIVGQDLESQIFNKN